eukprot:7474183-Pyramimonas_sp.AAC.1
MPLIELRPSGPTECPPYCAPPMRACAAWPIDKNCVAGVVAPTARTLAHGACRSACTSRLAQGQRAGPPPSRALGQRTVVPPIAPQRGSQGGRIH